MIVAAYVISGSRTCTDMSCPFVFLCFTSSKSTSESARHLTQTNAAPKSIDMSAILMCPHLTWLCGQPFCFKQLAPEVNRLRGPLSKGVSMARAAKTKAKAKAAAGNSQAARAARSQRLKDTAITGSSSTSDVAQARAPKRRQLMRRSTDEQVNRCISTHFRGVGRADIESKEVAGKSLRRRIGDDLRASRVHGRSRRFGTRYWRNLRDLYVTTPDLQALEQDSKQTVAPALKRALSKVLDTSPTQRSVESAQSYLKSTSSSEQARDDWLVVHS